MKNSISKLAMLLAMGAVPLMGRAQQAPARLPPRKWIAQPSAQRQHLTPNANLLFNGLGLTPAGQHVSISDMPMKMVIAPDRKAVVAVCAGFQRRWASTSSAWTPNTRSSSLTMPEAFNGLVFSPDGKRFYVSGGTRGRHLRFQIQPGAKPNWKRR